PYSACRWPTPGTFLWRLHPMTDYHTHKKMPTTDKSTELPTYGDGRAASGILSTISRGKRPRHIFALIYVADGCRKSTWGIHGPRRVLSGAEKGPEQLDVARFPQTESIGELFSPKSAHCRPRNTILTRSCSIPLIGWSP